MLFHGTRAVPCEIALKLSAASVGYEILILGRDIALCQTSGLYLTLCKYDLYSMLPI